MMLACQPRGLFLQSQPNTTYGYLIGARSQRRAVPLPKRGAGPVQAVQGENVDPKPQLPTSAPPKAQQQPQTQVESKPQLPTSAPPKTQQQPQTRVESKPQPPTSTLPTTQQQPQVRVKSDSQQSSSNQLKIQQQQQQPSSSQNNSNGFLQKVQQQWDGLDWQQRGYAVVLGVVVLAVVPQILSLLVLLLERVVIGGLLEFEEAFVALLFKGGALLGVVMLIGLAAAGVYLFARKTTK